jgi:hypothetical protein
MSHRHGVTTPSERAVRDCCRRRMCWRARLVRGSCRRCALVTCTLPALPCCQRQTIDRAPRSPPRLKDELGRAYGGSAGACGRRKCPRIIAAKMGSGLAAKLADVCPAGLLIPLGTTMQDAFKEILTPTWIISTLIGSAVLSILSAYLKDGIDKLLSAFSQRAAQRSTRRAEARRALIARLRTDLKLRPQYRVTRLSDAYAASLAMFGGISMMVIANGTITHGTGWGPVKNCRVAC